MDNFNNIVPVSGRQAVRFTCSCCASCCKNVRNSIALEPLDAFRIVQHNRKNGNEKSLDDILWEIADLKELTRGFHVFVLKTVNDGGLCTMLKDDRCTIYQVRPRTCRLYPFTAEPLFSEQRIKWLLCTEQARHFCGSAITARVWQKNNLSQEDEEYLFEECKILPELGKILRKISNDNLLRVEQTIVAYRYFAYDFTQPFLPQFKDNMMFLKSLLRNLTE